jgi:hypothetical protein
MRLSKILIRIGVGLLAFVAVVLAVRAVLNYTEGRALAHALAGLRAKGIPLTAKDLAPPCPDEDNAARIWKAAEDIVTVNDPKDASLIARVWTDFMAGKPIAQSDRPALHDMISKNQKTFELMSEMKDKPCFLYRDPKSILYEAKIPNAVKMLRTMRLLLFSASLEAEQGNVSRAVDQVDTGLKIAPMIAQEGSLLTCLIGFADARAISFFLGDILRERTVDDNDLLRLISALDPAPWEGRLAAAVRGEMVGFIEVGQHAVEGEAGLLWGKTAFLERIGFWLARPLLKRDLRQALPIYQELERQARTPYLKSREFFKSQVPKSWHRPWYAFLSKTLVPNVEAAFMKEAQIKATYLAARAGLACRLYKSRMGRYPESLEELVPGVLTEVPIDPFTGTPFVFRREGQGFIVYSLGSNQKDDGGRSTYMITQLVMDKDDDCSWREDR